MAVEILFQGSDEVIEVTILDGDGNAINPNSTSDIIISCYQNKEVIIQQWKKSASQVDIVDAVNGVVSVNLDRQNTLNLPLKRIYVEVAIQITNADFQSGYSLEKQSDIVLCDLKNSAT